MPSPAIRRLCVAVDLEGYSARDNPGQASALERLERVLEEACANAQLDRTCWTTQWTGDGELALLPAGIDEPRAIDDLIRELDVALYQLNRSLGGSGRLRLRMALHSGITEIKKNGGFAGDAVVKVCRLLDAEALKDALKEDTGAQLAVIVSDLLYDEVIRHDYRGLRAETYGKVHVTFPRKGFAADAWIHVPGAAARSSKGPAQGDAVGDDDAAMLTVHDPQGNQSRFLLRGESVLVGRAWKGNLSPPEVPIVDPRKTVSRAHCRLELIDRRWNLVVPPFRRDPLLVGDPTNYPGTYLRRGHGQADQLITSRPELLDDGDVILLAPTGAPVGVRPWELHFSDSQRTTGSGGHQPPAPAEVEVEDHGN